MCAGARYSEKPFKNGKNGGRGAYVFVYDAEKDQLDRNSQHFAAEFHICWKYFRTESC